jgi:flagellar hook-associated protein 3 FlgL
MTERITSMMAASRTINDINQALNRMARTQTELSTGKRINQPSDDPYGASLAVQLNGQLAGITSYNRNVSDGSAWAAQSDSSMSAINNIVQRVRELVVSAGNGTNSSANLQSDAAEVNQLIDAVKQSANASGTAGYIFSGTATTTAPYQAGAVDTYAGNAGAINRTIGPGTSLQVNSDISQVLGNGQAAADGKLLNTLRDIAQHMQNGTVADTNALRGADLQNLDANLGTLQQMQVSVGATENRLQLATSRLQDMESGATQQLSDAQDADMAQTAIDYSTEQASFTAALQVGAKIVQSSLMNFLA